MPAESEWLSSEDQQFLLAATADQTHAVIYAETREHIGLLKPEPRRFVRKRVSYQENDVLPRPTVGYIAEIGGVNCLVYAASQNGEILHFLVWIEETQ